MAFLPGCELKQELHQARLVMQQPLSPREPSKRPAPAPSAKSGGCQVEDSKSF